METIIISSEFYFKAPYCELTSDAKLLYAHLYTQALTGQEYISCTQKDAAKLLHCTEGTAGKALRSLQDIGLIERFVARRKETLISVYGTDGKPIQPQGDILPSTVAETKKWILQALTQKTLQKCQTPRKIVCLCNNLKQILCKLLFKPLWKLFQNCILLQHLTPKFKKKHL